MEAKDITNDLDLLGDWLDAKGYGEEAGLCTKAMDLINKQSEEIEKQKRRIDLFKNTRNEQAFDKLLKAYEEIERLKNDR